jgi:flagellar basal-body rod modification protein FlgD
MISALTGVSDAAAAGSASKGQQVGMEQFLRLLVTQLQHQDPLKPMEAREFTTQLAQFSMLEQAFQTNQHLKTLSLYEASANNAMATSFIGREVTALGDSVLLAEGGAPVAFRLKGDAVRTDVLLLDASGKVVRSLALGRKSAGEQTLIWDGKDQHGRLLPAGTYRFEVVAQDARGAAVEVDRYLRGRVTSTLFRDGQTSVMINGITVPAGNVLEVRA